MQKKRRLEKCVASTTGLQADTAGLSVEAHHERNVLSYVANAVAQRVKFQSESDSISHLEQVGQGGGRCVVIALPRRTDEDRFRTTIGSCVKALGPCCSVYQHCGVLGRGRMKAGEATTVDEDKSNMKHALEQLTRRLDGTMGARFIEDNGPAGVLPDATWCLAVDDFKRVAPEGFRNDQESAYTTGTLAGMVGCCASHYHLACALMMAPASACRFFIVIENDARLDKAMVRSTLDALATVKARWDMCLLHRGGQTPMVAAAVPTLGRAVVSKESVVASFSVAASKRELVWSSRVCGQVACVLSRTGAAKIATCGYHKELFCYDDFLNLANRNRAGTHFNSALEDLGCVKTIRSHGGLAVLAVVDGAGRQPRAVTEFNKIAFQKSDTSYTVF